MTNVELIKLAKEARELSGAVISNFKVGAALLTTDGIVFTGCNIEDPSGVGVTNICAERCAMVKALSEGYCNFTKIAVVGGKQGDVCQGDGSLDTFSRCQENRPPDTRPPDTPSPDELIFCTPCGVCRQYMNSYNPKMTVVCGWGDGEIREFSLEELLPHSFNEKF